MVKRGASKQEVIAILGTDFLDDSRDGANSGALAAFFDQEPSKLLSVQEKAAKWTNVLYYSTPELMTWVFLDPSNRTVDFALSAQ